MHFDEMTLGDYCIYAGALEAPGGYVAALVVNRLRGNAQAAPREAYRDLAMSGGHRWALAEEALRFAIGRGAELVRSQQVAC